MKGITLGGGEQTVEVEVYVRPLKNVSVRSTIETCLTVVMK